MPPPPGEALTAAPTARGRSVDHAAQQRPLVLTQQESNHCGREGGQNSQANYVRIKKICDREHGRQKIKLFILM